eukprot:6210907-Pleurochrysis_carterae.AAC.2
MLQQLQDPCAQAHLVSTVRRARSAMMVLAQDSEMELSIRTPSEWHSRRRQQILEAHPDVQQLFGVDALSLPLLSLVNVMHAGAALCAGQLLQNGDAGNLLLLCYAGSFLSIAQFIMLHDLIHGGVVRSNRLGWLRALSLPSFFGYYLYLRFGHLSHHRAMVSESSMLLIDRALGCLEHLDGRLSFARSPVCRVSTPTPRSSPLCGQSLRTAT